MPENLYDMFVELEAGTSQWEAISPQQGAVLM